MDKLSEQNFKALSQGLKELREENSKLKIQISQYTNMMGELLLKVQNIESQLSCTNLEKTITIGPTA